MSAGAPEVTRPQQCSRPDCDSPALCEGLDVCTTHIADQLGITYRQADYWARCGYLKLSAPNSGSGYQRAWPPEEVEIAKRIGRLTRAGLGLSIAACIARDSWPEADLGEGLTLLARP